MVLSGWFYVMSQTFVSFMETRNDKIKWMNLLLVKVESPRSQRTAVILVSRGVTLLVCGFGQLVFAMPQTFVPFTETRNDKTKLMNFLLEKVESPVSQRTAVILVFAWSHAVGVWFWPVGFHDTTNICSTHGNT